MKHYTRAIGPYQVGLTAPGQALIVDIRDGRSGTVTFSVSAGMDDEDFINMLDQEDCESYLPQPLPGPQERREGTSWSSFKRFTVIVVVSAAILFGLLLIVKGMQP